MNKAFNATDKEDGRMLFLESINVRPRWCKAVSIGPRQVRGLRANFLPCDLGRASLLLDAGAAADHAKIATPWCSPPAKEGGDIEANKEEDDEKEVVPEMPTTEKLMLMVVVV
mmetsp:Transcript_2307/g.5004  ORF Transcript_2307/g.5004 Transcript_2307/m.5004 type:complete len:113 (-) Transcript_2307:10-348(-)